MIPDSINRTHILRALKKIDSVGIAARRRSTGWDLLFDGKKYPPKYVISLAHIWAGGSELSPDEFHGGREANNFLIATGFVVIDKQGNPIAIEPAEEDEAKEFWEGRESYARHRRLERKPALGRAVKSKRLRTDKSLRCDVCSFSFLEQFGPRGAGFVEAHHTRPVSQLKGHKKVEPAEIALVCSNCHRMLHRSKPWLSIAALRKLVKKAGGLRSACSRRRRVPS